MGAGALLLLSAVLLLGYGLLVYAPRERAAVRDQWRERLNGTASFRALALDTWLGEEIADAQGLAAFPSLEQWARLPRNSPERAVVRAHMVEIFSRATRANAQEGIWLIDRNDEVAVAPRTGDAFLALPEVRGFVAAVRQGGPLAAFVHTHAGEDLLLFAARVGTDRDAPLVITQQHPDRYVLPVLRTESVPTRTAEAVLVDVKRDTVFFLTPLRHLPPRTHLRLSLRDHPELAAAAAARGEQGFGTYRDYRGKRVLAFTRRLTHAPWGLVVKVDEAEAMVPYNAALRQYALLSAALLLVLLGLLLGMRTERALAVAAATKHTERALREALRRLELALDAAKLQPYRIDVPAGRVHYGPEYLARLGYLDGRTSILIDEWASHVLPEDLAMIRSPAERMATEDHVEFSYRLIDASGSLRWIETKAGVLDRDEQGHPLTIVGVHHDVTRARAAEAALRESEQRFRAAFEQAAVGMAQTDVAGRFLNVNDRLAQWLGYTRDELRQLSYQDVSSPLDLPANEELRQSVLRSGESSFTLAKRYLHRDGRVLWGRLTATIVRKQDGSLDYFFSVVEDITAQMEAAAALQESEERHRALFETMQQGVLYMDRTGSQTALNPAAREILGIDRHEEAFGVPLFYEDGRPIPDEDRPYARAWRTGKAARNRLLRVFNQRRQQYRWLLVNAQPVYREGETEPSMVYSMFMDITELRETTTELRDTREMYRAVVENTTDVIARFDHDCRYLYINPACLRYAPYTPEQLIGHTHEEVGYTAEQARIWDDSIRRVFNDGQPRSTSFTLPGPRGLQYFDWRLFPEFDADGQVRTVVTWMSDRTAHRQLEAEYQQAQKMEAVGRLAGGVAHDFNNLITAIRGYGSLIIDRLPETDESRPDVEEIVRAADRAAGLTRQLLAFSRKQVLRVAVLDLAGVIRGMEGMLRRLIGEDVRLELHVADGVWPVDADAGQFEQVMMNLAVNARDAMPNGGALSISLRNRVLTSALQLGEQNVMPGEYVVTRVADTGQGMHPATLAHLFEPFFTTKEVGKGTGLGLSTAYGIIRQSGGAIHVDSKPDHGTVFEILLPRSSAAVDAPQVAVAEVPASSHGARTILVVEDEPAVLNLAARLLTRAGYHVLPADSGAAALAIAERTDVRVDLVLSDVVMPGMSGRDLVARLRLHWPDVPVLFMSGYTDDVVASQGLLEIGLSLLQKPFSAATLQEAVAAALA